MDYADVATKLIVSLVIGAVIGLERESHNHDKLQRNIRPAGVVGVRTFSLLTTLGAIAGFLMKDYFPVFVIISGAFTAILLAYYITHSHATRDSGFTTELGILYSFVIGLLIALEIFPIQFILALSVILIIILSRKSDIQIFLKGLQREEFHAFISYALIALVVLPFLPDTGYALSDISQFNNLSNLLNWDVDEIAKIEILNPFKLWFIVVAITGIDLLGHALERIVGAKKGRVFASIVGGFISSTATTISLAQESRTVKKSVNYLVAAAIFANAASFVPLLILILLINSNFFISAAPMLLSTSVCGFIAGLYFLRKKDKSILKKEIHDIKGIKESEIFALVPALKFGLLFLGVTIATRIGLEIFGNTGFLITSSLASLTGTDAVTVNISNIVGKNINASTGVLALILMNAVNLIGKVIYSFIQGKKDFAKKFSLSVVVMIIASLAGLLFV